MALDGPESHITFQESTSCLYTGLKTLLRTSSTECSGKQSER